MQDVLTSILFRELGSIRHHRDKIGDEYVEIKRLIGNDSTNLHLHSDEVV